MFTKSCILFMSTLGDPSNPLPTTQPHSHTQIEPTGFLLAFHSSFCLSVSNLIRVFEMQFHIVMLNITEKIKKKAQVKFSKT